ncbi:MAG: hypothetical protein IPH63_05405 [Flavobacteriales bacterium]|nr:hypothetical protein [Flavobacteriales bacterium]
MRILIFLLFVPAIASVRGQELVTIHGKVITSTDQRTYYDLMVVNKRTRSGT